MKLSELGLAAFSINKAWRSCSMNNDTLRVFHNVSERLGAPFANPGEYYILELGEQGKIVNEWRCLGPLEAQAVLNHLTK